MAGEGVSPPRKRGKYKLWTLDSNVPIPRTTKWRLEFQQSTSTTGNIEVSHDPRFYSIQSESNPYSIDEDVESRFVDNVETCCNHGSESDSDLHISESATLENGGQMYISLDAESDTDGLSSEEEESSSYESESEPENDIEAGAGCSVDNSGLFEEDNLLLYPNAEVSKLAAHVLVNLFVMEHKLSNQALEDLIRLINILLPDEHKFVRSGHLLRKYFVNLFQEPLPKRHKYCGRCLDGILPAKNLCNNEQCKLVNASVKEFLEIDLCNQLRRLYKGKCCCKL